MKVNFLKLECVFGVASCKILITCNAWARFFRLNNLRYSLSIISRKSLSAIQAVVLVSSERMNFFLEFLDPMLEKSYSSFFIQVPSFVLFAVFLAFLNHFDFFLATIGLYRSHWGRVFGK